MSTDFSDLKIEERAFLEKVYAEINARNVSDCWFQVKGIHPTWYKRSGWFFDELIFKPQFHIDVIAGRIQGTQISFGFDLRRFFPNYALKTRLKEFDQFVHDSIRDSILLDQMRDEPIRSIDEMRKL